MMCVKYNLAEFLETQLNLSNASHSTSFINADMKIAPKFTVFSPYVSAFGAFMS